jgi:integrase
VEKHPQRRSGDVEVFSPEEVRALVRAAASNQDGTLFLTAAFTGLRRGELLALHWRDIDFAGSTIRVRFLLGLRRRRVSAGGAVASSAVGFLGWRRVAVVLWVSLLGCSMGRVGSGRMHVRSSRLAGLEEVRVSGPSLPSSRSGWAVKGGLTGPSEASREAASLTARERRLRAMSVGAGRVVRGRGVVIGLDRLFQRQRVDLPSGVRYWSVVDERFELVAISTGSCSRSA